MANMSSAAPAGSRTIPVGGPFHDSILVTRLPTNMLRDELRQGVLGHFANFGAILRYSCAVKKNETTAHIQYSSVEEARNALNNGRIMNGHTLVIKSTDKHPTTKLMPAPPRPLPARICTSPAVAPSLTSAPTSSSSAGPYLSPGPSASSSSVRQNQQRTLEAFFRCGQDVKERKPTLEPKPTSSASLGSNGNAPPASVPRMDEAVPGSSTGMRVNLPLPKEEKPKINPCVKVEVYTPPPSLSRSSSSLPSLNTIPRVGGMSSSPQAVVTQAQLRPSRSLRDIFFFDIPGMKVISNNVGPSDALACQYLTGGAGRHPFPLAMMFGRNPGSVIMPLNCIMDAVKPGMEIKPATLELIWNGIESSVMKSMVLESAEKNLTFEKEYGPLLSDWAEGFLDDLIQPSMNDTAEEQISLEEDRMIFCEDVQEEIIEQVLKAQLEEASVQQIQLIRTCGEIAPVTYEDIEAKAVGAAVQESAVKMFADELCNDVIEELLSFYIDLWVEERLASASLKICKVENAEKQVTKAYNSLENEVLKVSVKDAAYNEFMNILYGEVIEDLLESVHFFRCVKVVAQNALRDCKEEMEEENESSDSTDSDSQASAPGTLQPSDKRAWTSAWVTTSLSTSQSSVESNSNYISPRLSSSPLSSNDLSLETESSSSSSSSVQDQVTARSSSTFFPATRDHSEANDFAVSPGQNNSMLGNLFGSLRRSMKRKAESIRGFVRRFRRRHDDDVDDDDIDDDIDDDYDNDG